MHLSTFSKASKNREVKVFEERLARAIKELKKKKGGTDNHILFPLDSTIITLTSKLLWCQGWHQVKLFCGLNSWTSEVGGIVIHFGQGHDSKHGDKTIEETGETHLNYLDKIQL